MHESFISVNPTTSHCSTGSRGLFYHITFLVFKEDGITDKTRQACLFKAIIICRKPPQSSIYSLGWQAETLGDQYLFAICQEDVNVWRNSMIHLLNSPLNVLLEQ